MPPGTKTLKKALKSLLARSTSIVGKLIITPINLTKNKSKSNRKLEIGPGQCRIEGFETVNVIWTKNTDYVADASKRLPFKNETFDLLYSSHSLEHTPWYQINETLKEWARVIKHGGQIEVWVPNGQKICQAFIDGENGYMTGINNDGWFKFNQTKDPCIWANGRIFSYGDGTGSKVDPNWHMTIFSPRFLATALKEAGFTDIEQLSNADVRGYDHGWINMGFRARKC